MSEAKNDESDLSALLKRVERLEKKVAELSQRTAGQQMIGPGLCPIEDNMLDTSRLDSWPPKFIPDCNIDMQIKGKKAL